jgi:predicted transcriptional regulator
MFAMMTTREYGALFLPTLDGKMDFSQGLFFSDSVAVEWLNDLFDYTKSIGKELTPKEVRDVWK